VKLINEMPFIKTTASEISTRPPASGTMLDTVDLNENSSGQINDLTLTFLWEKFIFLSRQYFCDVSRELFRSKLGQVGI
jgi:hypothetical protein